MNRAATTTFLAALTCALPAHDAAALPPELTMLNEAGRAFVQEVVDIEEFTPAGIKPPSWTARNAHIALEPHGFAGADLRSCTIIDKDNPKTILTLTCDEKGSVLALVGNGPWLRNESLRLLAALPELRAIRIDHNMPRPGSDTPASLYDGSGFDALADSKLAYVKIGASFDDHGMRALAKVRALRYLNVFHGKTTDEGIAALTGHPNIEEAAFSPMGRPIITEKTLATLATLPKLRHIGMIETFLTYETGFAHLKPIAGRLKSIDLKWSLVLPADLEKLKADHPGLEITTSTLEEVAAKPYRRDQLLKWASPDAASLLRGVAAK